MESGIIVSKYLKRKVQVDLYYSAPGVPPEKASLLLFNDGQDLSGTGLNDLLPHLYTENKINPLVIAGIQAGKNRTQEYGVAGTADYKGRGAKAREYTAFVLEELLPFMRQNYGVPDQAEKSFAGFSLGGLSALDIVWKHPGIFSKAGIFSGALWWRSKGLGAGYNEQTDRIMHAQIRQGTYHPGLKFFFECGTQDEKCDRNHNGVIDAIEDTLDIINELKNKGYSYPGDIFYHEIPGGKHDLATWKQALPRFLEWGWSEMISP